MSSLEPSYPTTVGPEYSKIAKTQEKDININYINIIEVLKEGINKHLKEGQENTNKQ